MHPSTNFAYQLAQLIDPIGLLDTGADQRFAGSGDDYLSRMVFALRDDVTRAIPSLLGMSFILTVDGQDVSFTSMVSDADTSQMASSLRVPLAAITSEVRGEVMFYASTAGALVDLAADLRFALRLADDELRLDEHLHSDLNSGVVGAREFSTTNKAVGFLMGRGLTVEGAQQHLRERAVATGQTPGAVAEQLVGARPTGVQGP